MFRVFTSIVVVVMTCGFSFSQTASDLKVRVLDWKNGRPVAGWKVGLLAGDKWLVTKTAKDGVASFRVAEPMPQKLTIDGEAGSWSEWSCSANGEFETSEVLQHGVVTGILHHPLCQRNTASTSAAHTGEIVLYVRHLNPWLTFRRVLWEAFYG